MVNIRQFKTIPLIVTYYTTTQLNNDIFILFGSTFFFFIIPIILIYFHTILLYNNILYYRIIYEQYLSIKIIFITPRLRSYFIRVGMPTEYCGQYCPSTHDCAYSI